MATELERMRIELAQARASADYYKAAFARVARWKSRLEQVIGELEGARTHEAREALARRTVETVHEVMIEERQAAATLRAPLGRVK